MWTYLNAATTTTTFLQLLHMIIHTTCRHNTICYIYKYTNTCNILYYVYMCTKIVKKGVLFRLDDVSSRNMCVKRAFFGVLSQSTCSVFLL